MSNNTAQFVTPYKAAGLVNAKLAELGLKTIPTQMMYNYTYARTNADKKSPIPGFDPKKGIDLDGLATWMEGYIAKRVAKAEAATEATETQDA